MTSTNEEVIKRIRIRLGETVPTANFTNEQIELALEDASNFWIALRKKSEDIKDFWIERYAYCLSMELLGFVRSKYVNSDNINSLNYKELIDVSSIERSKLESYVQ